MRQSLLLLFFLSTLLTNIICQEPNTYIVYKYDVGETGIFVNSTYFAPTKPNVVFINLHDDEKTSVQAAEVFLSENGGKLLNITNSGERIISIKHKGKKFSFDPNRIYSSIGVKSTLQRLSSRYDPAVASKISDFGSQILTHVDSASLVIALHNNKDSGLSVISYQQEQAALKHFGSVYINPDMDPDDFMLTNDSTLFKKITDLNFNVVYENSDSTPDDGSLSLYAGYRKIPYINIEAQHEHFYQQLTMLEGLYDIIKSYRDKAKEQIIPSADNVETVAR